MHEMEAVASDRLTRLTLPARSSPPPGAPLAAAGVEWSGGNTLALDLADWILRMEAGWSYTVGADLWVWITLREGAQFTTDIERVEKLLQVLTDSTPQQVGKTYVPTHRGGRATPTGRAAREGLVYGEGSALAWAASAPWHYVVRSRRCQAYVGDDLIGYSLTIAPTPAGAALAAWAEAYAQDALFPVTAEAEALGDLAATQGRLAGWAARLKERRALWRQYKARIGPGAEGWQVGF